MRTNWLRSFARTLLAAGLLAPAAASAASYDTNLVLNPSFENVDGNGNAADWTGLVDTYAYSQNYTGAAPAGAGARYWFGGAGITNQVSSISASQAPIDLAANAADINAGRVTYDLSAFFSSYRQQGDYAVVSATFRDAGNTSLGQTSVGSEAFVAALPVVDNGAFLDARGWAGDAMSGLIPAGTNNVLIEIVATKSAGGTVVDGYMDLVDFQLHLNPVPEPSTLALAAIGGLGLAAWRFRKRR
ncbi:MAG: PEP-CTERM sorting domain-containing protein [Pirellulales bacterium]